MFPLDCTAETRVTGTTTPTARKSLSPGRIKSKNKARPRSQAIENLFQQSLWRRSSCKCSEFREMIGEKLSREQKDRKEQAFVKLKEIASQTKLGQFAA